MIDFRIAKQIASEHIDRNCILIEKATIKKPYGWYFCWQSKAYVETDELKCMLVGNAGFLVEKENGRIVEFGSNYPLKIWIVLY